MRERPSIILPDDHDIFQGNVWGEGGRVASRERDGGLLHPARFQQIVRRTQAGSLPAPFDPTPMQQGIDVATLSRSNYLVNVNWLFLTVGRGIGRVRS